MEAACGAAHRKSEMGAWGFPGVSRYKSRLSQPFLAFCDLLQGLLIFHCSYIFLQAKLAPSAARCDPCSSVVNNGRAHPIHALPLPQCGVGRHAAQACGRERQEAQAAGAPRRLARLGPPHDLPVGLTVAPLPADGPLHPRAQRDRPGCGALQPAERELRLRRRRLAVQGALRPGDSPQALPGACGLTGRPSACRPNTASGWPRSWARSGPMHASWPSKTRWAHGPPSPSGTAGPAAID